MLPILAIVAQVANLVSRGGGEEEVDVGLGAGPPLNGVPVHIGHNLKKWLLQVFFFVDNGPFNIHIQELLL